MDGSAFLTIVLPWAVILFQACLIFILLRQQGRALLAQQELQERLATAEASLQGLENRLVEVEQAGDSTDSDQPLAIGSQAPEFVATDLEGRERRLEEFLGQPLVVAFFSPSCGFCREMAPRLGQLPEDGPRVLLVSEGDAAEHRRMAEEHHWRCDVVLQKDWEVSNAFRAGGTPTGYLLDREGRIASGLAIGADALLRLVDTAPRAGSQNGHENGQTAVAEAPGSNAAAPPEHVEPASGDPPETPAPSAPAAEAARASGAGRRGLSPGVPAPAFSLPDLDGEVHSLEDLLGQPLLLVFSEPECAPCQPLAKELARRRRRNPDGSPAVVMISRGDAETNRELATEHGITFPVLLQERYEVAGQYGSFATPVAYLIDEQGAIASELAVGPEAIIRLL